MNDIWQTAWKLGGVAISGGFCITLLRITHDWGQRGEEIKDCAEGLSNVAEKFDAFTEMMTRDHGEITRRLDRTEYILTGDKGVNGMRGEIKDIHKTLFEQNEQGHKDKAELTIWQTDVDVALERRKKSRRKNPGRRKED